MYVWKKEGGKKIFVVQTVLLKHTVTTVGYIVYERRSKLRQDLLTDDKKITAENLRLSI